MLFHMAKSEDYFFRNVSDNNTMLKIFIVEFYLHFTFVLGVHHSIYFSVAAVSNTFFPDALDVLVSTGIFSPCQ